MRARTTAGSTIHAAVGVLTLLVLCGSVCAQETGIAQGVNPADNITKIDLIYRNDVFQGGVRNQAMVFKYDRALDAKWGVVLEVPMLYFSSPGFNQSGLGDALFRIRHVQSLGPIALLGGAEVVAPTAAKDTLGTGRWQLSPVVGGVFSLLSTAFLYAGYKHTYSAGGSNDRPGINQSQPRAVLAYTSRNGWWLLGDLKVTLDHKLKTEGVDIEAEAGTMVSRDMAISARIGTSGMDSARNATLGINLRHIF